MLDFTTIYEMMPSPKVVVSCLAKASTKRSFCFVVNVSKLAGVDAIEIVPGFKLRRAETEEVEFIKELIESLFGRHFGGNLWETRRPTSGRGAYLQLPAPEWRYFVIDFNGGNQELALLDKALGTAKCGLEIGFTLSWSALAKRKLPMCVYSPPRLFQSLQALSDELNSADLPGETITGDDAAEVSKIYAALSTHDHNILDLNQVFKLLFEMKDLPRFSPLQILGFFAVLESILTHPPHPEDRYDSITRQIKQKLALLNNRWQPALDYSVFGTASHDKLWARMYEYRSAIAHGTMPDFNSQLRILQDARSANFLISEVVRKIVCQALLEPRLVADLRNC